ncbi:MAG: SCP2 sterol-binding domain-containing protein [Gammaproteobacteria bacterium]
MLNDGPRADDVFEALTRALNAALNRALALDSAAAVRLGRLEGRTLAVVVREHGWRVLTVVRSGRLNILRGEDNRVDVTISGRPSDFIALVRANQRGEILGAGRVEIQGDLAVAQEVQSLLGELDLDWEEWLAGRLGDIAAHHIGRAMRGVFAFGQHTARKLEADTAEYLRHELMIVPRRDELERYGREVFELADALERSEARLRRLLAKRSPKE